MLAGSTRNLVEGLFTMAHAGAGVQSRAGEGGRKGPGPASVARAVAKDGAAVVLDVAVPSHHRTIAPSPRHSLRQACSRAPWACRQHHT